VRENEPLVALPPHQRNNDLYYNIYARELGEGYKILYSGEKSSRNGVGVILSLEFKEKVVEVSRPSDRLVKLTLVIA
jgi:hypothetical protein